MYMLQKSPSPPANAESSGAFFGWDSTLRSARCTRGSADDSTHDPSSDRLSLSAAGRSVAAPADALPTREPRSSGDLLRGDAVAAGASRMGA